MGKGDLRTRRGKIFRGTHGNARSRKREKAKAGKRAAEPTNVPKPGAGAKPA
jgi:ribosomal small subunit protein bTHX